MTLPGLGCQTGEVDDPRSLARSYQTAGIDFLKKTPRALLADDAGLGKSYQVLVALDELQPTGVVVVAPAVAIGVWKYEVPKWLGDRWRVRIQPTTKPVDPPAPGEILVTSYSRARLNPGRFGLLVCDESHKIKNPKAKQTGRCAVLAGRARRVWLLTGTPILKDPMDLWHQLKFIGVASAAYRNFQLFQNRFHGYTNRLGQLQWGNPSEEQLRDAYRPADRWVLRRKKQDELDLPPRVFEDIYVELPKRAATEFAEIAARYPEDDEAWQKWGTGGELAQALANYSAVKAAGFLRVLKDYPHCTKSPLVIFTAHKEAAQGLAETLDWPCITGEVSADRRTAIADGFQQGKYPGLVATIGAAGVGLTLTRASTCVFVSKTFVPALNSQAADRIYRISQKNSVRVINVKADSPLEFVLSRVLRRKAPFL